MELVKYLLYMLVSTQCISSKTDVANNVILAADQYTIG